MESEIAGLTPLEVELLAFHTAWKDYWDKAFEARDQRFGKDFYPETADEKKALREFERQYELEHPKIPFPEALKLSISGCTPSRIPAYIKDGSFSKDELLVLKEKHGSRYFLLPAGDIEAGARIAMKIIHERLEWGYYSMELPEAPKPPETPECIGDLPEKYKKMAEEDMDKYNKALKYHKEEVQEHELLMLALSGDKQAAVRFMRSRRDGQYEGYEIIRPEVA